MKRVTMKPVTMQFTVKTLNGEHYVLSAEKPEDRTVRWLKERIYEMEPSFTPFSQQIFPVIIDEADEDEEDADKASEEDEEDEEEADHELSDHELLLDTHYQLLIHPDRIGVTFIDHTRKFGEGFTSIAEEVQARLPTAAWWEEQMQAMSNRYHNTKALTMSLAAYDIVGGDEWNRMRMTCSMTRTAVGEPWTKRVSLSGF